MEKLETKYDQFIQVKESTGQRKQSLTNKIVDNNNQPILETNQVCKHWKQYIKKMFAPLIRGFFNKEYLEGAPDILILEITRATKNSKTGKASGPDEIHLEIPKLVTKKTFQC